MMSTRPPRRYASSMTPEAQAEIPALVEAEQAARRAWKAALLARNAGLRRHYDAGVDPRDLCKLVPSDNSESGHVDRAHITRIVRNPDTA